MTDVEQLEQLIRAIGYAIDVLAGIVLFSSVFLIANIWRIK